MMIRIKTMKKSKTHTYISLFSSAGVGCYGFKLNNFKCVCTNEFLPQRMQIQKNNQKCKFDTGYICGDIKSNEIKKLILNEVKKWNTDVTTIVATPPCQGMSVANHKKGIEKRNSLIIDALEIIETISPKTFILENVRSFLKTECTDNNGNNMKINNAINNKLSAKYNIYSDVINFKDYGSNSSRTRTIVIGVRKDINVNPSALMPDRSESKTLKQTIGHLQSLKKMGEISKIDAFHSFREYNPIMLKWIENLKEGSSAFTNTNEEGTPHYWKNGKKIYTKNGNAGKYTRQFWSKTGPCIHTRNDAMASQNTIHPSDNRVFSIRELMIMMTIPNSFQWLNVPFDKLQKMKIDDKRNLLKKNDLNIRKCIGEAVPTEIFNQMAKKINLYVPFE